MLQPMLANSVEGEVLSLITSLLIFPCPKFPDVKPKRNTQLRLKFRWKYEESDCTSNVMYYSSIPISSCTSTTTLTRTSPYCVGPPTRTVTAIAAVTTWEVNSATMTDICDNTSTDTFYGAITDICMVAVPEWKIIGSTCCDVT